MNEKQLELIAVFVRMQPDMAAHELELLEPELAAVFIDHLPIVHSQRLIIHMFTSNAARVISLLEAGRAAEILSGGNPTQISSILRCLTKPFRKKVLDEMEEKIQLLCRILLSYPEDAVGAWMIPNYLAIPSSSKVKGCIERVSKSEGLLITDRLPILNAQKKLVGLVLLADLFSAKSDVPVKQLMSKDINSLSSRSSLVSASKDDAWQNDDMLTVLNRDDELIGLLRHSDLRAGLSKQDQFPVSVSNDSVLEEVGEIYASSLKAMIDLSASALNQKPQLARRA